MKVLCDSFRDVLTDQLACGAFPEMHRTLCCFMKLEIDFFLKIMEFFECNEDATPSECNTITEDLRDEYPLSMFNEALMEFFDASMAHSEGSVKLATEFTKFLYYRIERWHVMLEENFYNNQLKWRLPYIPPSPSPAWLPVARVPVTRVHQLHEPL